MALSDAVHTIDGKTLCLYVGLGLIAFGSGGIKPCVSAFMGDQFGAHQKHLLPKAYAAFYWCINLGSTAAFLTIPLVRKTAGYGWAFGIPGIAMAVATFVFWLGTKHYVLVPPASQTKSAGFFKVFWHALKHRTQRAVGQRFWDTARTRFSETEVDAARSVGPILMVFALAPVFWALFDQTFSTWVLQGEQMRPRYFAAPDFEPRDFPDPDHLTARLQEATNAVSAFVWQELHPATQALLRDAVADGSAKQEALMNDLNRLLYSARFHSAERFPPDQLNAETRRLLEAGTDEASLGRLNRLLLEHSFPGGIRPAYRIGPEEMLSANPILVMIFVPILTLLVYPALGRWATPLKRMASGMFLAAGSFVIVAWFQHRLDGGEQMSVLWQFLPYIVLTVAEVLFSTTGLEFAYREAAPSMKSIIMGFWTLTVAVGNLLVTGVTNVAGLVLGTAGAGRDVSVTPQMFLFYAGLTFIVAILFSFVTRFYRYRDSAAAQGR
jgi:dipeptide/tripeptide permease